jgi:hypothetical protein
MTVTDPSSLSAHTRRPRVGDRRLRSPDAAWEYTLCASTTGHAGKRSGTGRRRRVATVVGVAVVVVATVAGGHPRAARSDIADPRGRRRSRRRRGVAAAAGQEGDERDEHDARSP